MVNNDTLQHSKGVQYSRYCVWPFWDGSVISDINAYGFIKPTFRRPWSQHCYMLQLYNIKSIASIISEFCLSLWSLYDHFHMKERGNDTKVKVL